MTSRDLGVWNCPTSIATPATEKRAIFYRASLTLLIFPSQWLLGKQFSLCHSGRGQVDSPPSLASSSISSADSSRPPPPLLHWHTKPCIAESLLCLPPTPRLPGQLKPLSPTSSTRLPRRAAPLPSAMSSIASCRTSPACSPASLVF